MSDGPRFTRRHWGRELLDFVLWPASMFTSKHKRGRELSMQRVILGAFVFQFFHHFPTDWDMPAVAAMAVLTFALIVETLFAAVPVREGLAALVAIFGGAAAKRTRTVTLEEETTTEAPPPDLLPANDGARG